MLYAEAGMESSRSGLEEMVDSQKIFFGGKRTCHIGVDGRERKMYFDFSNFLSKYSVILKNNWTSNKSNFYNDISPSTLD